jgi:hypothetical protein
MLNVPNSIGINHSMTKIERRGVFKKLNPYGIKQWSPS